MTEKDFGLGLVEKAKRVLPGGTFGNFPGDVVTREGRGGRVWDESGKEYVDSCSARARCWWVTPTPR